MNKQGLVKTKTYIRYSDLFDQKLSLAVLKKELRRFKLSDLIVRLAQINILLAREEWAGDDKGMADLQGFLVANFIEDEILEGRLKPRFGQYLRDERPIFTRQQMLALMRLSALVCSETGRVIPNAKEAGGYALGRCCLIMNDHLISRKEEQAIHSGAIPKQQKHLGLQMGSVVELYNPSNLLHAMVRSEIMFSDILKSKPVKEKVQRELRGFDLAQAFRDSTKLTLEQYQELVFTTVGSYYGRHRDELIRNPDLFVIHRSKYINNTLIRQQDFDRYLALDSIKLSDLPTRIREQRPALPHLDFAVFRERPLLELDGGHLICIDPSFLIEKLGAGLHWTILNSLKKKEDRDRAFAALGYLFEFYVDRIMQQIYPPASGLFMSFPKFEGGEEAFDGIVCLGSHLIVMEYKGGFLKQEAKYSGKIKAFEKDLDSKFGIGRRAGVYQLVSKIERLFHREPDRRDQIPGFPVDQVTKVTPLLVVREPFLRTPFMNWMLNNRFKRLLRKRKVTNRIEIAPLTVIDIDSLELLKANLIAGDFSLEQCLNARNADDPEQLSAFHSFNRAYFPGYGRRKDSELAQRLEAIEKRMARNLFGDERLLGGS
jgi:hypothetical protein